MTAFDKKVNQIAARHGWNIEKQARAAVPCYIIAAPTYEDGKSLKRLEHPALNPQRFAGHRQRTLNLLLVFLKDANARFWETDLTSLWRRV